jgi:hypothetical protein
MTPALLTKTVRPVPHSRPTLAAKAAVSVARMHTQGHRASRTDRRALAVATSPNSAESTPDRPRYTAMSGSNAHRAAEISTAELSTHTAVRTRPLRSAAAPRIISAATSQSR